MLAENAPEFTENKMHTKLKLLFVTPSFNPGGAEGIVIKIANAMSKLGHEVHLCVINGTGPKSNEVSQTVTIHDLKTKRTRYAWFRLVRKCNEIGADLIFSSIVRINSVIILFRWAFNHNPKIVIREPSIPSISIRNMPFKPFYRFVYKNLYKNANRIIAQSQFMLSDLVNTYSVPENLLTHIYNPVDIAFDPSKKNAPDLLENNNSYLNAVVCGRLDKVKGIDILLEALSTSNIRDRIKISIIGEGPLKKNLINQANELGITDAVKFTGYKSNPSDYFKNADFTILPSRWEGLPNVVLESMAVGTPVLATNCPGGIAEIIHENINGILVENENVDALKKGLEKMEKTLNNFDAITIKASIDKFSSELIMDKYNKLFMGLCGKK